MADEGVCKVHNPPGDAPLNHQAAGQNEQGNGDQGNAVRAGEEALNYNIQRIGPLHDAVKGHKAQRETDRHAHKEEGEQKYNINHARSSL